MASLAVYCFSDIIVADEASLEFEELSPNLHLVLLVLWKNNSVYIKKITFLIPMFFTKSIIRIFMANMKILFKTKTFWKQFLFTLIALRICRFKFRLCLINILTFDILMSIHFPVFSLQNSSASFVSIHTSEFKTSDKFVQRCAYIQPFGVRSVAKTAFVAYFDSACFTKYGIFTRVALFRLFVRSQYRIAYPALYNFNQCLGSILIILDVNLRVSR